MFSEEKSGNEKAGSLDSGLSTYMRDMTPFGLMSKEQEQKAFRHKEETEKELYSVLAGSRSFKDCVGRLAHEVEGADPEGSRALLELSVLNQDEASVKLLEASRKHESLSGVWESIYKEVESEERGLTSRKLRSLKMKLSLAKNAIVTANLRLVIYIAKRYGRAGRSMSITDLIQEGNIGLMRAVDKFDWKRETKFATYAVWWIKQSVRRALVEKDKMVRIPVHMADRVGRTAKLECVHFAKTGRNFTGDELSEIAGATEASTRMILGIQYGGAVLSLDAPAGRENTDTTWVEVTEDERVVSPVDSMQRMEAAKAVRAVLGSLTDVEKRIIMWRFAMDGNSPLTLQEIANKFGLTRERIRQIESRALSKLRDSKGTELRVHL